MHLLQQRGLRISALGYVFDLLVVCPDALADGFHLGQQRSVRAAFISARHLFFSSVVVIVVEPAALANVSMNAQYSSRPA